MSNFSIPPPPHRLIMAKSRDWPDLRWPAWQIRDQNESIRGLVIFWKFSLPCHWQRCKVAAFCDHNVRIEWEVIHAKFQLSIANGSAAIAGKPSEEWQPLLGRWELTLFRAGGLFGLLQVFFVSLPNAARYSAHTWRLFLTIHCAHFSWSGQVRSSQRVCWPHLEKSLQSRQS